MSLNFWHKYFYYLKNKEKNFNECRIVQLKKFVNIWNKRIKTQRSTVYRSIRKSEILNSQVVQSNWEMKFAKKI